MFSHDGSPVPGHPPESSLRRGRGAWCTNAGAPEKDVDLALELPQVCLVTNFEAANGGLFFLATLKEALVFASMHPINLEDARQHNGRVGSEWAKKLSGFPNTATPLSRPTKPLAAFCFPPPPQAFTSRLSVRSNRPVVARYIHFKLLGSHKATDGRQVGESNKTETCLNSKIFLTHWFYGCSTQH